MELKWRVLKGELQRVGYSEGLYFFLDYKVSKDRIVKHCCRGNIPIIKGDIEFQK